MRLWHFPPAIVLLLPISNETMGQFLPSNHLVAERLAEVDHLAWAQIDDARRSEPDRVREMLRSNDPKVVSLAIYAASAQCRPDLLIEAVWLIGDARAGLPRLTQEALQGELVVQDTPTIGEYFRETLGFWMRGLPYEPAALCAALEARPDPWHYSSAWRVRLERLASEQRTEELLEARRHLREQPETLQWIVAMRPPLNRERPTLTEDDIRAILSSLSPETKQRIADRTIELPPDIATLREKNPQYLESFFARYEQAVAALGSASPEPNRP